MTARATLLCLSLLSACAGPARPASPPAGPSRSPLEFLRAVTRPWPSPADLTRLVSVAPGSNRVAIYDNALVALLDVRLGKREEAAQILGALARLQREDGALYFSFDRDHAVGAPPYIRAGAIAWVGFAAVAYLDADREGAARAAVARMCHELARYLLAHQVHAAGDLRDGLITGGEGTLTYEVTGGELREAFAPGEIAWASTEHNIDAFFFLRALARVAERPDYAEAADEIAHALLTREWSADAGQMNRGADAHAIDTMSALDCASWGSLFLLAAGARDRAETALTVADTGYAARDGASSAAGHRPYARGRMLESEVLARYYGVAARDWASSNAVWPEGSAGVALAALRLGKRARAASILQALEPLRDPSGGLPMLTIDVPPFDTRPSVAGTAWVELVRDELAHSELPPLLWPG